jgi:hypothetical protein
VLRITSAVVLALLASPAVAQIALSNAAPVPLETVRLQIAEGVVGHGVHLQMIDETATRIAMSGNRISVTLRMSGTDFDEMPPSQPVDLSLGQFPKGQYTVEVLRELPDGTPAGTIGTASFTVGPAPAWLAPPINYTDIWWNPAESGWGLNVIQHGSGVIFATWFVYGADGKPTWYVMPDGQWNTANEYTGRVYRTTGPPPSAAFDPSTVTRTQVGYATLTFNVNGLGIQQAMVVMNLDRGRIAKFITPQSF